MKSEGKNERKRKYQKPKLTSIALKDTPEIDVAWTMNQGSLCTCE